MCNVSVGLGDIYAYKYNSISDVYETSIDIVVGLNSEHIWLMETCLSSNRMYFEDSRKTIHKLDISYFKACLVDDSGRDMYWKKIA